MMNFFDKLGKKANEAYQVTKEKNGDASCEVSPFQFNTYCAGYSCCS